MSTDPDHTATPADRLSHTAPFDPDATNSGVQLGESGQVIAGRYRLVSPVGEGGMGSVWMAEQTEPVRRQVAVKLIKAGMDTAAVLARFEAERQALAIMDHPNIARVLDGGTTESGRPFFVMELVKGPPLHTYCDRRRLTPRQRLELFVPVCQAIQHAHQKGVIHRDIKPSNILVAEYDGRPVPKVIDFGVAKATGGALTDRTLNTGYGAVLGTPVYMSPEQADPTQVDIDTRSDVYSLGVVLYELLAGSPPFRGAELQRAGLLEMLRVIREDDPPRPSTKLSTSDARPSVAANRGMEPNALARLLRSELDWVVMKALEKDRNRRYDTANGFAADIQRYLAGEAVLAVPPSASYRLRKWGRKNRGPVAAAALVLAAVVAGIVGTTWGLIRADGQRQIAEANARDADRARADAEERARAEEAAKNRARGEAARAEREKDRADAKAGEVRHALYAARQQVAMNAWRENRADLLTEVLGRQQPAAGEPDLRGFEWAYLDRLARSPGRRWQANGEMVNGVAISPDDRTAVTVGFDGKATAWDVPTGTKKWDTGDKFRWSVNAATISPDGRTVALAGHLGQLQLWTLDGTFRAKLDGHQAQVFGAAFSPDGKVLASASADLTVRLWDAADGKPLGVLGKASDSGPGVRAIPQTNAAESTGHTNMVWQAGWAPDGKRLATCSTDGSIKVWSYPEKKLLRTLTGHDGIVVAVAWAPDGKAVASISRPLIGAGGGEVKVWNPDTGRADATFRPPTGGLHAVAFTPDGLFVVTAGTDRTVRVWRKDGRLAAEHRGFRDPVIGLAVGGGGRWAVAGTNGGEIVALDLDVTPGKRSAVSAATRLAMSRDGRLASLHTDSVGWHDPDTLAETAKWPAVKLPEPKKGDTTLSAAAALALRADGQAAHNGTGYNGAGTVVWRDAGGQVRHLLAGHVAPVTAVAFLPGDRMASADENGTVRIWDGATGEEMTKLALWDGPVRFLIPLPDGRVWAGGAPWAAGSKPAEYQRRTAKDGRLVPIDAGQAGKALTAPSAFTAADLSPDGRTLVAGRADGTLVWLDAADGRELRTRTSAAGAATAVAFSPTERRVAVGRADAGVRLLDADSGEELLVLDGLPGAASGLAFTPDGRRLVAAASGPLSNGKIVVWDGRTGGALPPLPSPDLAWHKERLAAASNRDEVRFGSPAIDPFAARYHLTRLAALDPDQIDWPRALLAMDQNAGDFKSAVARLDGILKRWPDDATMWYDQGNAKREVGDVAGSEAAFRKCIALAPDMAEGHCNLGLLVGREGRFAEAVEHLTRGHELGAAQKKAGKRWDYPSAAWLARHKRFAGLAEKYAGATEFADVPARDSGDLIEVLTLTKRPLAAVTLADPKPDASPGPVVVGAALRCGEGIGDAEPLTADERAKWRAKALGWLKRDFDDIRAADAKRGTQAAGMGAHPLLQIARGDRLNAWPPADREAWQKFWAEVDAAAGR